jgi:antitoxin (DNA-binding transcriptional repressor) of toxin-antitoxin stability system
MIKTIAKNKLKAHMLEIFRSIERTGEEMIVTDHNRPVLKIVPLNKKIPVEKMFSEYQGKIKYLEDINTPTESEWEK